jgi:hypothetical protein
MDQLCGCVEDNSDDNSNYELIPTPLRFKGVSKCGHLIGGTSKNIYRFTGDMTGKGQNVAPHTNKDSIP